MRTAIVTGARTGIGRACADRLLREGWRVLGLGRSAEGVLIDPKYKHYCYNLKNYYKYYEIESALDGEQPDLVVCAAGISVVGSDEPLNFLMREGFAIDVLGTINLIQWCQYQFITDPQFITFGWDPMGVTDEMLTTQSSQVYGVLKGAIERWSDQMGHFCIRPGFVRDETYWKPNEEWSKKVEWQTPRDIAEQMWTAVEAQFDA